MLYLSLITVPGFFKIKTVSQDRTSPWKFSPEREYPKIFPWSADSRKLTLELPPGKNLPLFAPSLCKNNICIGEICLCSDFNVS